MSETPSPSASDPVVFSRPIPWSVRLGLTLALVASALGFFSLVAGREQLEELLKAASMPGDPFLTVLLTMMLVEVLLGVAFLAALLAARRRYGHCELMGDQAVFSVALALGGKVGKVTISLNDVAERTEVPGGVLLRVKERGRWANTLFPLLLPTKTDEELAKAIALLDRSELEETLEKDAEEARFGRAFPMPLHVLLVCAVLLPLGVVAPLGYELLFQAPVGLLVILVGILIPTVVVVTLASFMISTRYRRATVGRSAILFGNRRLPYADIQRLAKTPPFLAFEGQKSKALIWFGDQLEDGARLLDDRFEAAGLALRIEDTPPGWAAPGRRRRREATLVALFALVMLGVVFLFVRPPEIYGSLTARDDMNNTLRLVYRIGDQAPVFLFVDSSASGPGRMRYYLQDSVRITGLFEQTIDDGKGLVLDLVEGVGRVPGGSFPIPEGSTCLSLDSQGESKTASEPLPSNLGAVVLEDSTFGMLFDCASLPALLERADPQPKNSVLADFIAGESSNRYFEAADAQGWKFVWGVAEGRPVFAYAARASQGTQVVLGPFLVDIGLGPKLGGVMLYEPRHKLAVVWTNRDIHAAAVEAPLPSVEILRATAQRIRAGEGVKEAAGAFLEDLWPPNE